MLRAPILLLLAIAPASAAAQITDSAARQLIQTQLAAAYAEQSAAYTAEDKARAAAIGPTIVRLTCALDGDRSSACATATHNWGASLFWQGRFADAAVEFERALTRRPTDPTSVDADIGTLGFLATTLEKAGNSDGALAVRARTIARLEATRGPDHPETQIARTALAHAYDVAGHYGKSEPLYRAVLESLRRTRGDNDPETLRAMAAMPSALLGASRPADGLAVAEDLLARNRATFGESDARTAEAWASVANMRKHLGHDGEAIDAFRTALTIFDGITDDPNDRRAFLLKNLAESLEGLGRHAEAEPLRRRAIAETRAFLINRPSDNLYLALNLIAQRKAGAARTALDDAIESAAAADDRSVGGTVVAVSNLYRAELELDAGNAAAARAAFQAITGPGTTPLTTYYQARVDSLAADLLALEGRQGEAAEAWQRLLALYGGPGRAPYFAGRYGRVLMRDPAQRAAAAPFLSYEVDARIASDGVPVAGDGASLRLGRVDANDAALYRLYADALWAAGARDTGVVDRLFATLQRSMAGKATQALALKAAREGAASAGSDLGKRARDLQTIEAALAAAEAQVIASIAAEAPGAAPSGRAERERLEASARQLRTRRDALVAELRRAYPAYFDLVSSAPVTLAAFQKLLGADEAALLVVPTSQGTQLLAITHDKVQWHRAEIDETRADALAQRLLWFAGADVQADSFDIATWQEEVPGRDAYDRKTAYALHQALVAPLLPTLAGKRHLFVAAGGAFARLPFTILVSAPPTGLDNDPAALRDTRWFADDFAIAHLPSLQSLALLRGPGRAATPPSSAFLGIGDPLLDGAPQARGPRGGGDRRRMMALVETVGKPLAVAPDVLRRMARLPGTARELEQVAATRGGQAKLMMGDAARELQVTRAPLDRYGIVTFATHGLMAGEIDGITEPGLVLTPPVAATAGDDGFLSMSDIAALRLNADWVILSACNSAGDDGVSDVGGLSGLARAFFYAGADSLLASHWPVFDAVSPDLVTTTLREAAAHGDKASALQKAMATVRQSTAYDSANIMSAHPQAWAAFTLFGDWR